MKTLLTMTAISILALSACGRREAAVERSKPPLTNGDLAANVAAKLNAEPALKGAQLGVEADAAASRVTLSGTVLNTSQRERAVEIAKSEQKDVVVADKMQVEMREVPLREYTEDMAKNARSEASELGDRIGNSLEDAWIHSKITAKMIAGPKTPKRKINVDVVDGVVTLRGKVPTVEAKAEAEHIAKNTESVKGVKNLLMVDVTAS
jgi:osmotically-inducible protein OsmY